MGTQRSTWRLTSRWAPISAPASMPALFVSFAWRKLVSIPAHLLHKRYVRHAMHQGWAEQVNP